MKAAEDALCPEPLHDIHALIWEADPETFQFTYVSQGAERLLGYSLEQWLGRPKFWVEMLHPDDRAAAVDLCCAAVADGRDHEFEYRAIASDGRVVWIRDIVRVSRDPESGALALRGAMLDITDRRNAASALAYKDSYLHALVEQTLDIITVVARDGCVIYDSPAATRVMGYPPDFRVGRSVFDDVHTDDVPQTRAALERTFMSQNPTTPVQFRYRHANGTWRTLEAVGRSFVDERQQLVGIINSRDITERIVLEEDSRHRQKMEALGRLTGSIAHDFNNVLTTILGNADLMLDSEFSVGLRPQLIDLRHAAEIGAALTRQLLLFSDKRPRQPDVVDVSATIHRLQGVLRRLAGTNVIVSVKAGTAGAAEVYLGPGNLEQIMMNLVLNARDAMPWGGTIRIAVRSTSAVTSDGSLRDTVTIEVADTGVGISRHVRARIFEPYFTTKAPGKGTGLGLATVYGIVTDAGGVIEVDSELSLGTRFLVHLPRAVPGERA